MFKKYICFTICIIEHLEKYNELIFQKIRF